jgi:hypothetical protein
MNRYRYLVFTTSTLGIVLGCAPDSGGLGNTADNPGTGNGGATSTGSGGDTGLGLGGDGFGTPGNIATGSRSLDGGALTADAACSQTFLKPESIQVEKKVDVAITCTAAVPEPIALYIVLDNSGSMKDSHKWPNAVSAITTFVQGNGSTPGAAWACVDADGKSVTPPLDLAPPGDGTISVGIQYFHPIGVGSNPNECDGSAHSTPAVDVAPIPANAPAIVGSLGSTGPNGNTPTVGALTGGVDYCSAYQPAHPGTKCVVVLVTDGQPNGCGLSSNCGTNQDCVDPASASTLTPIANNGFTQAGNSVMTFTIGMEGVSADGFTLLDAIAIAGGSDCTPGTPGNEACNVTTSGTQGFVDALNAIRSTVQVSKSSTQTLTTSVTQSTALPCEWKIPTPPVGKTFDKDLVNVGIDSGSGLQQVGKVATEADCASAGGGWYYDDVSSPTRILACPDTCGTITGTPNVSVQVLFGCATKVAVPR